MRPLRDRLAEAIRRSRVGNTTPWERLNETTREDYRQSADSMLALARGLGFQISQLSILDREGAK